MKLSEFSFHEADVVELRQDSDCVVLVLNGLKYKENDHHVRIKFCDVKFVMIDSISTKKIEMYYESGEVLNLSQIGEGRFEMLIEWTDFTRHSSVTKFYEITCKLIQIDLHEKTK